MKNNTLIVKIIMLMIVLFFTFSVFAQSTASYTIIFSSNWENENVDPINGNSTAAIPSNAHWSDLVGTTHNSNYVMLAMGSLASTGIKNVAEGGANGALMSEVLGNANANQWLQQEFTPFAAISSATLNNIVVSSEYPLLSLVSMIAPSPDWMIAINSINLRDGSTWINEIIIPLHPYDAGTDSGTMYASEDEITTPSFEPISSIINVGPFNDKPIGTMTITLDQVLSVEDLNVTEVGFYPNPSKGIINIDTSTNNILKEVIVYDVLGKQVAKREFNTSDSHTNIDLNQLNQGIYLVRIRLQDGSIVSKKLVLN